MRFEQLESRAPWPAIHMLLCQDHGQKIRRQNVVSNKNMTTFGYPVLFLSQFRGLESRAPASRQAIGACKR